VEHRWGERVQVAIPVRLSVPPYAANFGAISNISMSGVWIRTNLKLSVLGRARITFQSTQWLANRAAAVPAYGMRQDLHGIALEWCELAPRHVNKLLFAARSRVQVGAPCASKSREREESANPNSGLRCDAQFILDSQSLFGDFTPAAASLSTRTTLLGPIL
jgi:hypothetical protein